MKIERNKPLASLTTWQVGGPAEYFCQPAIEAELREALEFARQNSLPVTALSGGSNVLVADSGIKGLVISLRDLKSFTAREIAGRLEIEAHVGMGKSELLKLFLKYKLAPALFLAGLPGDVGGGVVMNAGVSEKFVPREFVEITDWVEVMRWDGTFERLKRNDLKWSYRHCHGWQEGVLLRVGLSWPLEPDDTILSRVRDANKVRLSKQPLDMPSCGSTFVNPLPLSAGALIDQAGLKGFSIGGAQVSRLHANFIVNTGGSTAADIHAVIEHVKKTVFAAKGVHLKTEVVYLGQW